MTVSRLHKMVVDIDYFYFDRKTSTPWKSNKKIAAKKKQELGDKSPAHL